MDRTFRYVKSFFQPKPILEYPHPRVFRNVKSFQPKTILEGRHPLYVYSDEFLIQFVTPPRYSLLALYAYDYVKSKYNHKEELDVYMDVAERNPYPSLEDVIEESDRVSAIDRRFREFIENMGDLNMRLVSTTGRGDLLGTKFIEEELYEYIDSIYEKCQ